MTRKFSWVPIHFIKSSTVVVNQNFRNGLKKKGVTRCGERRVLRLFMNENIIYGLSIILALSPLFVRENLFENLSQFYPFLVFNVFFTSFFSFFFISADALSRSVGVMAKISLTFLLLRCSYMCTCVGC